MCSLLTEGKNRGSLLIRNIKLKENSISTMLEKELSKPLYMVTNLCQYDLHTIIYITVIRITGVMPYSQAIPHCRYCPLARTALSLFKCC